MFIDINEFIARSREERQSHLQLSDDCIEIGGHSSTCFKGLLAHFLGTTIPTNPVSGPRILICHACHNAKCSNPRHLYWGTDRDNWLDQVENQTVSTFWDKMVSKYGEEEARRMCKEHARKGGLVGGGHDKRIFTDVDREQWLAAFSKIEAGTYGWISRAAREMNCSHTHVRRIINEYFPNLK